MKKYWLTGLVLAAGLGLASAADAQIKFGVAGPITGPNASFGAQLPYSALVAAPDARAAALAFFREGRTRLSTEG